MEVLCQFLILTMDSSLIFWSFSLAFEMATQRVNQTDFGFQGLWAPHYTLLKSLLSKQEHRQRLTPWKIRYGHSAEFLSLIHQSLLIEQLADPSQDCSDLTLKTIRPSLNRLISGLSAARTTKHRYRLSTVTRITFIEYLQLMLLRLYNQIAKW